jgi:hypothetical protein
LKTPQEQEKPVHPEPRDKSDLTPSQDKQQRQAQADRLWAEGIALERRGDLNGALRKFEEAYRVVPNQNAKGQINNLKVKISQSQDKKVTSYDSKKGKKRILSDEELYKIFDEATPKLSDKRLL